MTFDRTQAEYLEPVEHAMTSSLRTRRGFTLIELLVGMVISAIIGVAMVRVIMSQTRFMDNREAWRTARSVSRGSLNRLITDLRMVEVGGGLEAAAAGGQDFTVRVPYAFGVVCSSTGSSTTAVCCRLIRSCLPEPDSPGSPSAAAPAATPT